MLSITKRFQMVNILNQKRLICLIERKVQDNYILCIIGKFAEILHSSWLASMLLYVSFR